MDNNMSLYNADVRRLFHAIKRPKGMKIQIVERSTYDDLFLAIVFFRDNFDSYDGEDRRQVAMSVKEFMEKVRGMGIPIYLQAAEGDGRVKTN